MVSAAWESLAAECARWRDAGRTAQFWWRDDDATRPVPALERLFTLARASRVPLALAVVPQSAEGALFDRLEEGVCVLQHGCDHLNRASPGEKKTEFPAGEAAEASLGRLGAARARLSALAGKRSLDVLVPPWNRLREDLVPRLSGAGFRGLSRFGTSGRTRPVPGLRQFNTHVDIVDWHCGRGFIGEDAALAQAVRTLAFARSSGDPEACEALGWLTHHARHDEAAWGFLARLFELTQRLAAVRWIAVSDFFDRVRDQR